VFQTTDRLGNDWPDVIVRIKRRVAAHPHWPSVVPHHQTINDQFASHGKSSPFGPQSRYDGQSLASRAYSGTD
jgi:hypothetical protein